MSVTFDKDSIARFRDLVADARRIVITCHLAPDGDAIGSSLAMAHLLRGMGKSVRVLTPDEMPHALKMLPGTKSVMAWSSFGAHAERSVADADLILCLDYNALYRTSRLEPFLRASQAPKVLIDHHKEPEDFATVAFSYPDMSASCELCTLLIEACGWWPLVTTEIATCLMAGIITDTGGFHYNSSNPELFDAVARLMRLKVDKDWLMRCLVDTKSADSMRLEAYALSQKMEVDADAHAALITLSRDELNEHHYKKGDTEGLVNKPLAIPGVVYSVYLREEADYIKVSMRSLGDFPVDLLCKTHYSGGGHLNAAGGEFRGTLRQAVDIYHSMLQDNKKLITEKALHYATR